MKDEPTVQTAIRIPESWIARLDAIAGRLAAEHLPVKQAAVIRAAMGLGIEALEVKYGLASPAEASVVTKGASEQKGGKRPARKPAK